MGPSLIGLLFGRATVSSLCLNHSMYFGRSKNILRPFLMIAPDRDKPFCSRLKRCQRIAGSVRAGICFAVCSTVKISFDIILLNDCCDCSLLSNLVNHLSYMSDGAGRGGLKKLF